MRFIFFVSAQLIVTFFLVGHTAAQTDLRISGANAGFPVAVPRLCDAGGGGEFSQSIADGIAKNLSFSGLFNVINPGSYIEASGKCSEVDQVAYSDWSVIGAEGLVRGKVEKRGFGDNYEATMYLMDVLQKRPVLGKRYEFSGTDTKRVVDKFSNEIIRYFTGHPGVFGSSIAFVSRVGRFKELFIMNMDGSGVRQLTRDKALVISPAWSPSGDRIVFTSYRTRKPDVYFISPEGGSPSRLTDRDGMELGPKFAPDGRSLILAATTAGMTNLMHMNLDGKILRKVTNSPSIDVSPSWSPDGAQLAFCSNRAGGPQIYLMDFAVGDSSSRRISYTSSNYCTSPAWSPRGDKVAFVCRDAGNQIFVSDPKGEQLVQITFRGNNEEPNWSPDGRYLAFSSDFGRGGARNIVVYSLLTGSSQQITEGKSENSQPAWSPVP